MNAACCRPVTYISSHFSHLISSLDQSLTQSSSATRHVAIVDRKSSGVRKRRLGGKLLMAATTLLLLSILLGTALSYKMSLWENTLKDIITKNKRVVESKYITFTTTSDDGWPAARTVVFRGFHEQDNKVYLKFISDSRSQKISDIAKNNKVELCWYLTKNKDQFRIRGHAISVGITSTDAKAAKLRVQLWNGLSDGARSPFFFPGNPGDLVETPTIDLSVIKVAGDEVVTNDPKSSMVKTESVEETGIEPAQANIRKKFVPIIPDPETVRALRAERKTGEEEPSKDVCPPPDCFNLILVDPITVDHLQLGGNGHGQSRHMHTMSVTEEGDQKQYSWKTQKLNP